MKSGNGRQPHLYPLPSVLTLHKSWTIFFYSPTCFFYSPTCETYSPSCISRMPGCEGLDGEAFTGVTNGWQLPFCTHTYILYLSPQKTFTRSQTLRFWLISIRSRREGLGWWSLHKVSHCSQPGRVWPGGAVNTWKSKPSHAFTMKINGKLAVCEGVNAFSGFNLRIGFVHFRRLNRRVHLFRLVWQVQSKEK